MNRRNFYEEILLNNDDVKDAKVLYNNTQSGVNVYLEIEFNKQGKEKLQEISRTYNSNAVSEDTTNSVSNNTVANEITEEDLNAAETANEATNTTTDGTTDTAEATSKKIDMVIDGTTIAPGQQFSEENTTGTLDLLIGTGSALNTDDENNKLDTYITQAQTMASLIKNGVMPITYSLESNKYIESPITVDLLKNVIIVLGAIAGSIIYLLNKDNVFFRSVAYCSLRPFRDNDIHRQNYPVPLLQSSHGIGPHPSAQQSVSL